MSRETDLLFCEVVVDRKPVARRDVEAALRVCDSRERMGAPRPRLGDFLVKKGLLSMEIARKVYDFVEKKPGAEPPPDAEEPIGEDHAPEESIHIPPESPQVIIEDSVAAEKSRIRPARRVRWVGVFALVILAGIGAWVFFGKPFGRPPLPEIARTPLAGVIGGERWTFVQGHCRPSMSDFWALFYGKKYDPPCDSLEMPPYLEVPSFPTKPGCYAISSGDVSRVQIGGVEVMADVLLYFKLNNGKMIRMSGKQVFVGGSLLQARSGFIIVEEVTPTVVRGRLHAEFDAQSNVEGEFELNFCGGAQQEDK